MKRILFLLFPLFSFYSSYACHNCTVDNLSYVNNGNNTTTFTIDLTIDVGSTDGYSYGFAIIFENTTANPPVVLNSPAFTPTLTKPSYNDLTGYTGANIGSGLGSYNRNYFDDRYGNRTDVLTYETDDDTYGFGSVDYTRQVVVTLSGCVESITIDGDFRSSFSAVPAGNVLCTESSNTGISCVTSCGTCSSPTCLIAGPYTDYNDASVFSNHCSQMNDLSASPITSSTYTSYHSLSSSSTGTLGMVISVQEGGPSNPCGVTKIAKLYPTGTNCSAASSISSTTTTANGSTFYNPEWTGLTPNTNYIVEVEFTIPSGCSLIDHCESYYYPSSCNVDAGTYTVTINGSPAPDPNNVVLQDGETVDIVYNNDGTLPPQSVDQAGIGYDIFSCIPTFNPLTEIPPDDPCYLGTNFDLSFNINDSNNGGQSSSAAGYSELWFLPTTMDDMLNTANGGNDDARGPDVNGDNCWTSAQVIHVTYSPPSTSCGSCSNANCPITHVATYADRFNGYYPLGNCNAMGNISNITYITYHTITADPNGAIGLVQQLSIAPQGCETRSAVLRPIGSSCSSSADIQPNILNANGVGSGFNPEWYGLSPGAQYIVILTTNLGVGCQMDRACLVSYDIPGAPPSYNCGTVEFNITDNNDVPLTGPFVYDCSDDTVYLAAIDPPSYFVADQWVYPGFLVTVTPNSGTWDGVNSVQIIINGVVIGTLDPNSLGLGPNDVFIIPITYAQPENFTFGVIGNNGESFDYEIVQATDGSVISSGIWTIGGSSQTNAGIPTASGIFSGPGVTNDPNNGGKGFFDPSIPGPGVHTITYTFDNGDNCSGSYTIDVTVNGPDAAINGAGPFCETSASIPLSSLVTGDAGGTWTINGVSATDFDPISLGTGNHVVEYTVVSGGCSDVQNQIIIVLQSPITSNENVTLCYGDSVIINGTVYNVSNPTGQETFTSVTGCDSVVTVSVTEIPELSSSINPTICEGSNYVYNGTIYDENNTSGIHVLNSVNGCDSTVTISINIQSIIENTIDTTVCNGESIIINGTIYDATNPNGQEVFTIASGCDSIVYVNLTEQIPDTSFIDTVLYIGQSLDIAGQVLVESDFEGLVYLDANDGCDSIISAKVVMLYESAHFMPTGFSPNGDGSNDVIGLMGGGISEIKLYIYNRWGERVFSYEGDYDGVCPQDPLCNWDGQYNNQPVNVATYVFYLKGTYINGEEFSEKGTISLIK